MIGSTGDAPAPAAIGPLDGPDAALEKART